MIISCDSALEREDECKGLVRGAHHSTQELLSILNPLLIVYDEQGAGGLTASCIGL